jgi:hypothetical protein
MPKQCEAVPKWIQEFLAHRAKNGVALNEAEQIAAGREIQSILNAETDPDLREYINDLVANPKDGALLTDLATSLTFELDDLRELKAALPPVSLLVDMEQITSKHADSGGYSAPFATKRYPARLPKGAGYDSTHNVPHDVSPLKIARAYYKLGNGRFNVGPAMVQIISFLQERFGLDFNDLERQHQAREEQETMRMLGLID